MGKYLFYLLFLFFIFFLIVVRTQPLEKEVLANRIDGLDFKIDTVHSSIQENNKLIGELRSMVQWLYDTKFNTGLRNMSALLKIKIQDKFKEQGRQHQIGELISEFGTEWIKKNITGSYDPRVLLQFCEHYEEEIFAHVIKFLLLTGSNINITEGDYPDNNALNLLIKNKNQPNILEGVRNLVSLGINVNYRNERNEDAVILLAKEYNKNNRPEIIQLLISSGFDIKQVDKSSGYNYLTYFCEYDYNKNLLDVVKILTLNGVDVNYTARNGENIVDTLCTFNKWNANLLNIVNHIISAGFDVKKIKNYPKVC